VTARRLCADGDFCYRERHLSFFGKWHSVFVQKGLAGAIEQISNDAVIPACDFLRRWKVYCNKITNRLMTLSSDSIDLVIVVGDLQAILQLNPSL
jgi:hypothetical protein